ncbi:MAG: serine hydrolase domain-containing protein [Desulfomonilaceae bacterium]
MKTARTSLKRTDALFLEALDRRMFTAAAVIVLSHGDTVHQAYYGTLADDSESPVNENTLFDLASLTKVVATTPSWFFLSAKHPQILDAPLIRWFPDVPSNKAQITPRLLLAHSSGLPAWRPYYLTAPKCDPQTFVRGKIFSEPLIYEPGQGFTYSDLGFILLSFIIQLETSFSLDQFTRKFIYEALGLEGDLMFKPYEIADRVAPTRPDDPPGLVNDLNARSLGGISGHAGLFGTVRGVTEMARQILLSLQSSEAFFNSSTVSEFCSPAGYHRDSSRGLGFDTNLVNSSSCGDKFKPKSVGHTGFTGTSLWIDPERELVVTLLTNRVYMGESDFRIKIFRPLVHDTIVEELDRS